MATVSYTPSKVGPTPTPLGDSSSGGSGLLADAGLIALLVIAIALPILPVLVQAIAEWTRLERRAKHLSHPGIAHPCAEDLPRLNYRLNRAHEIFNQFEKRIGRRPSPSDLLERAKQRARIAELEKQIETVKWALENEAALA